MLRRPNAAAVLVLFAGQQRQAQLGAAPVHLTEQRAQHIGHRRDQVRWWEHMISANRTRVAAGRCVRRQGGGARVQTVPMEDVCGRCCSCRIAPISAGCDFTYGSRSSVRSRLVRGRCDTGRMTNRSRCPSATVDTTGQRTSDDW